MVDDTTLSIFGRPLPQFTVADTGPGSGSVSVSWGSHSPVPPPLYPISFTIWPSLALQRTENWKLWSLAEAPVASVTVMTSLSSTLKGSHTAV